MTWYTEHNANIEQKKYCTQKNIYFEGYPNFLKHVKDDKQRNIAIGYLSHEPQGNKHF